MLAVVRRKLGEVLRVGFDLGVSDGFEEAHEACVRRCHPRPDHRRLLRPPQAASRALCTSK